MNASSVIIRPKHALSHDKAMEQARKLAAAVLKPTGLSPAWLSEFQVQGTNSATSGTQSK